MKFGDRGRRNLGSEKEDFQTLAPLRGAALVGQHRGRMQASAMRDLAGEGGRGRGGSGLRTSLGLGSGLASLSASLAAMPAARTHAGASSAASALLRSVGYHDAPPAPELWSLYRQPGTTPIGDAPVPGAPPRKRVAFAGAATEKAPESALAPVAVGRVGEEEAAAMTYEERTASVAERLGRLSRLTTDNFLRAQAELDWEEERAGLVSGALNALHLTSHQTHVAEGGLASMALDIVQCVPVAGFTQAPLGSAPRAGSAASQDRWLAGGRPQRLAEIVERINLERWRGSSGNAGCDGRGGGVQPLRELAWYEEEGRTDTTLDTSEGSEARALEAAGPFGFHWRYLAELYRILHSIVSSLDARRRGAGGGGAGQVALGEADVEEALVQGSLDHLHAQFRGMIKTIFESRKSTSRVLLSEVGENDADEELLCAAVHRHLVDLKVEHKNKSLWPKVLCLMRCGKSSTAAKLLRHHVIQSNEEAIAGAAAAAAHAHGSAAAAAAHSHERAQCRNDWCRELAHALEAWQVGPSACRGGPAGSTGGMRALPQAAGPPQKPANTQCRECIEGGGGVRQCRGCRLEDLMWAWGGHDLQWALNLYVLDDKMVLGTRNQDRYAKSAHYKLEAERFSEDADKYTNAVLCLLNYADARTPGQIPRPSEPSMQAEPSRYECQLHDLPPLLGDAAGNLVAHLGLDAGADRLAAKDALISRDRRVQDVADRPHVAVLLEKLPGTALVIQKSLWRLVQDHVWRHLAFVRPVAAARVVSAGAGAAVAAQQHAEDHALSLQHCQTHGVAKILDAISKCPGWGSFKHCVTALAAPRSASGRGGGGGSGVVDAEAKSIVAYNVIQMLFFTLQFGKGLVQLSKLGPSQLVEAVHMAVALHYYGVDVHLDEFHSTQHEEEQPLVVGLVSQLLHAELLVFAPPEEHTGMASVGGGGSAARGGQRTLTGEEQLRRAIHYCLLMQEVPREDGAAIHVNRGAVALLAQLCLTAPAADVHFAFRAVVADLCGEAAAANAAGNPESTVSGKRATLLRKVMHAARVRAGEQCVAKGHLLLQDAALCFYWAERDAQPQDSATLNMQRYLGTTTALLDVFAAPGRGGSRQTRANVLDHCSALVDHMIAALGGGAGCARGFGNGAGEGTGGKDEALLARQARDLVQWLSAGRRRMGSGAGGTADSMGSGAGGGDEGGTRRVTMLAQFLHTWQVAKAHEVMAAGMPLDALRELLHLPCDHALSRQPLFAPQVATLLSAFSSTPATASVRGGGGGGGQVCFLPCWKHAVNAEDAVLQVEKMVQGSLVAAPPTHLVPDAIILALQCLLSLKKSCAHKPHMGSGWADSFMGDYSSDDMVRMLSPQPSSLKRRRQAGMSASPYEAGPAGNGVGSSGTQSFLRRRTAAAMTQVEGEGMRLGWGRGFTAVVRSGGDAGMAGSPTTLQGHEAVLEEQHKLLHALEWHVEELRRCVERLVARNLCLSDLSLHVHTLLQSSLVSADS